MTVIDDPQHCREAGIPDEFLTFKTKYKLALEMVGHARDRGMSFGWVRADAGYGKGPTLLKQLHCIEAAMQQRRRKSQHSMDSAYRSRGTHQQRLSKRSNTKDPPNTLSFDAKTVQPVLQKFLQDSVLLKTTSIP
jgi:hypothetical protein